jgi:hypothetical protein
LLKNTSRAWLQRFLNRQNQLPYFLSGSYSVNRDNYKERQKEEAGSQMF